VVMSFFRIVLAFLAIAPSALPAAELHFAPGAPTKINLPGSTSCKGELVSLTDKEVTWRDESNNTIVEPIQVVLGIDLQAAAPLPHGSKYTEVVLTDNSLLHSSRFLLKGKEIELTLSGSGQVFRIPLLSVASILNDAQDAAIRQEWHQKHLSKNRTQDFLAFKLKGGGGIGGFDGTLSGNDKGDIVFELDSNGRRDRRELAPAKVQGLIFFNTLGPQAPSSVCQVHDIYHNVLVASRVAADAKGFTIATVSGATFDCPRSAVARLDYRSDKLVYLSDLKPVTVIEKSRQGRQDNWKSDKNLENGSLQLEGQVYGKGLSLHSHTELVYALDGKYKEFKAIVGMDDMVGGDGQPLVKIEADGKELFARAVSRKDKRQELVLDVKGTKQLRIIVTSSGLFDFGDHVDFADARLCK
jgi:NPCBM/NEW2 domain